MLFKRFIQWILWVLSAISVKKFCSWRGIKLLRCVGSGQRSTDGFDEVQMLWGSLARRWHHPCLSDDLIRWLAIFCWIWILARGKTRMNGASATAARVFGYWLFRKKSLCQKPNSCFLLWHLSISRADLGFAARCVCGIHSPDSPTPGAGPPPSICSLPVSWVVQMDLGSLDCCFNRCPTLPKPTSPNLTTWENGLTVIECEN